MSFRYMTDYGIYEYNTTGAIMEGQVELQTGKKHDEGKPDLSLIPTSAIWEEARVMTFGKKKYGANNWRNGLQWSRCVAAALRHITAFNGGEDLDPETGISHLAHAKCCLSFLIEYSSTHPELDDRYKNER